MLLQGVAEQESRRGADAAEKLYFESFDADGVSAEDGALEAEHEVRGKGCLDEESSDGRPLLCGARAIALSFREDDNE